MYKILLADEEGVALEALRVMLDSQYNDTCDIRLAANTSQLNDIYGKFLPDIVFINIQMAGMHGIASIRDLHNQNPNCLFTVLTHNRRTDFGRDGKNVGILHYLQKPFGRDKIIPIMKDFFSIIDIEKKQEEEQQFQKQQWDEAIPMMEGGMISEMLFPDSYENHTDYYMGLLGISYSNAWLIDFKYSQITEHGTMCNPVGSVVLLSNSYSYFRKIVKAFFHGSIVGPILANHVIVLVPCAYAAFTPEEEEKQKKRTSDLAYQLHRKLNLRFRFGISSVHPLSDMYPAIQEARYDMEN